MTTQEKIRKLINQKIREIHANLGGTVSMGDIAVYIGQPMTDAMTELVEFVEQAERQRAVEICDLNCFFFKGLRERESLVKFIRDPDAKYPSQGR